VPVLFVSLHIRASAQEVYDTCRSVDVPKSAHSIAARTVAGRCEGLSELGDQTTFSAKIMGLPFWLTTEITHAEPPYELNITMVRGTLRFFEHRFRIEESAADPGLVKLSDELTFESHGKRVAAFLDRAVKLPQMRGAQSQHLEGIKKAAENGTYRKPHQ
jgi:hypothetical protein